MIKYLIHMLLLAVFLPMEALAQEEFRQQMKSLSESLLKAESFDIEVISESEYKDGRSLKNEGLVHRSGDIYYVDFGNIQRYYSTTYRLYIDHSRRFIALEDAMNSDIANSLEDLSMNPNELPGQLIISSEYQGNLLVYFIKDYLHYKLVKIGIQPDKNQLRFIEYYYPNDNQKKIMRITYNYLHNETGGGKKISDLLKNIIISSDEIEFTGELAQYRIMDNRN